MPTAFTLFDCISQGQVKVQESSLRSSLRLSVTHARGVLFVPSQSHYSLRISVRPSVMQSPVITKFCLSFFHPVTSHYKVLFILLSRSHQALRSFVRPSVTQSPVITKVLFVLLSRSHHSLQSSVCPSVTQSPLITKFCSSFCPKVTIHYGFLFVLLSPIHHALQSSVCPSVT